MNGDAWERPQCLKVALLPDRNTWIKLSTHGSRKVADAVDLVLHIKKPSDKSFQIQPLELRLSDVSVVEIDTINVYVGPLHNLT